jgi:cell division protein FtsL
MSAAPARRRGPASSSKDRAKATRSAGRRRAHLRPVPAPAARRGRRRLPFLIVAFALTAVLVTGVVSLQAMASQTAFRMQALQDSNRHLQQRYDELRLEAAQLSAPERVEKEARRLGFEYPAPDRVHTIVARTRIGGRNGSAEALFALERLLGSAP